MTTILQSSESSVIRSVLRVMALLAATAAAQNGIAAEPAQDRSKIYKQAKSAYEADRFQECKAILLAVDERTPIMTTLLAEAECELHEYRACATHMAESLRWEGHNSSIRKSIEEMLTEAANEVGAVTLSAKIEGAEVSVDGQVIGKTPLDGPVYLDVGTRKIAVAKSGYVTITREIEARKGTSMSLSIDLPEEGKASVPMTQAAPAAHEPLVSKHSPPPAPVPFQEIPPDPPAPNPLLLVTGGVVAIGGLVTGLVFNGKAGSEYDEVDRLKKLIGPSGCFTGTASAGDCDDIASHAKGGDRYRRIANISAVAGSAALIGTVAYWLWPRGTVVPTSTTARFNAAVAPGGAWVGMDSACYREGGRNMKISSVTRSIAAVSLPAIGLLIGCGTKADHCENLGMCPTGGVGGNGETHKGGSAGTSNGGATNGGFAGLVSSGGSSVVAGAAGTTAQLPCNGACKGSTPYCDEFSQICVACLTDANCTGATPACDTETNVCVGCITDQHCPSGLPACTSTKICAQCTANTHCSGTRPACDTDTNVCVECLSSANCTNAAKPQCNADKKICVECLSNADCKTAAASKCDTTTNTCGPCGADTDCTQIPGKNVCLTGVTGQVNQCVQCTGKKYLACGQSNGKALVCDSLSHTCTVDKTVQSAGLCQPCVSDAQCSAGKLCYLETFNASSVGYFCFWKQGDTANGAPADCTVQTNRPYMRIESNVSSIDNDSTTLCTLRSSTCTAYNQFSNVDCAPTGTPNDALCGFDPGADSKCMPFGSTTYRCTTVCSGNDDCKFTCNTGVSPNTCTFQ